MTGVYARYISTDPRIHDRITDAAGQLASGWSQNGDQTAGDAFFAYNTTAEAETARGRITLVPGIVRCFLEEGPRPP